MISLLKQAHGLHGRAAWTDQMGRLRGRRGGKMPSCRQNRGFTVAGITLTSPLVSDGVDLGNGGEPRRGGMPKPGATPRGMGSTSVDTSPERAGQLFSVPDETFVVGYPVFFEKLPVFILKAESLMVPLLPLDVPHRCIKTGFTHRKAAITGLPMKRLEFRSLGLYPSGRSGLELFHFGGPGFA